MGVRDRAAMAIARMDQTRREMAERRALRARNTGALRERTGGALRDRASAMMAAAKQAAVVGQRRDQAGGWATTSTDRDRSYVMGFGVEDENTGGYRTQAPQPARPPATAFVPVEEQERPAEPTPPPTPAPPPVKPAPRQQRPARPAVEIEDEDDFSNQSSWLRNQ